MTIASALLVAMGAWLWLPRSVDPRIRALLPVETANEPSRRAFPLTTAPATVAAAIGCLLLIGGLPGIVLAVACVVGVPRFARRLEPRATRERRARLTAQAPLVADLLAATMAAGSPMRPALAAVSHAVGDPSLEAVRPVVAALDLGADNRTAWLPLVQDASLGAIAAAMVRSADSGAPLSTVLTRIADDLRREHQVSVQVAARAAGVKAVLPLAACFLPAFLLLGVVPVVASLAGGLFA